MGRVTVLLAKMESGRAAASARGRATWTVIPGTLYSVGMERE